MVDTDATKQRLLNQLVRWLILAIPVLVFRFLRWGGVIGLLGIGTFVGAIWLSYRLADPDTNELTGPETALFLGLLMLGVALYVGGVRRRRRRNRAKVVVAPVGPYASA